MKPATIQKLRDLDTHLCAAFNLAGDLVMEIGDHTDRYNFAHNVKRRIELVMIQAIKIKQKVELQP